MQLRDEYEHKNHKTTRRLVMVIGELHNTQGQESPDSYDIPCISCLYPTCSDVAIHNQGQTVTLDYIGNSREVHYKGHTQRATVQPHTW